jgi:anti-sigma regulatory factor (Ser/Thr protein kinase)
MPMMEALMDSVHVQHTADGTVVVLRRTLAAGDDA